MAKTWIATCLMACLAAFAAPSGAACTEPVHSAEFLRPLPETGIDQARFAEALRLEANFARCRNGVAPLGPADGLTGVAAGHAGWMAKKQKLSHDGGQRFKARMRSSGVSFRLAAENIASYERYAFPEGSFRITDQARCRFRTEGGAPIPPHSYASLARRVVLGWMSSSGHRRNLLSRRLDLAGAGIGFDGSARFCGRYYISQSYAG